MITLYELAMACYLFRNSNPYEESYNNFRDKTKPLIDLNKPDHREALIDWLNDWRCRIGANNRLEICQKILSWYKQFNNKLFPIEKELWELSDQDLLIVS